MIKSIVFSKDRPLQLHLTLSSINKNLITDKTIEVLYKCSDDSYYGAYEKLKNEFPYVSFIEEKCLFKDIFKSVSTGGHSHVVFFTDDNIFYRPIEIDPRIVDGETACLSLRMGKNINYRQHCGKWAREQQPDFVDFFPTERFISWYRMSSFAGSYWNYPLSVDGHIFKTEVMSVFCQKIWEYVYHGIEDHKKQTPNYFEQLLQRFFFDIPVYMIAPQYSCVVNSPNNRVQNDFANSNGSTYSYSPSHLLNEFNTGKRINLEKLDFSNVYCPHQEIELL